jgi:two-component system sensor histidine kinase BaeS
LRDGVLPVDASTLGVLADTVNGMERLVNDLHQLASNDAGHAYHVEAVDLAELVDEACGAFAASFRTHRLTLDQDIAAAPALLVWADRQRLNQVLTNLLCNTMRYTDEGGQAKVTLALDADGQCRIRIDDSAPGVPDSALPRMFERFFRVEESRGRAGGGSGLGLAICRAIVHAHGGSVTASHSGLGGVRMEIILPRLAGDGDVP